MKNVITILLLCISTLLNAGVYYVSSAGNDGNTGLSEDQSWLTVAKVSGTSFVPGDSILFSCGNVWRESLTIHGGNSTSNVYYGAYGTGAKPLFLGSKEENSTNDWVDQGGNIWQNSDASFTVDVANIIFNNNESFGVKIMSATPTLDSQGEFWYDYVNDRIRMYSVGNPASVYSDIECVWTLNAIVSNSVDYVTFQNLEFCNWGRCVTEVTGNYQNFYDLDINYIGGGDQDGDYAIRYGNGLQFWEDVNNITVERCTFYQVYDAAISPQGDVGTYTASNIYFRNNLIKNCEYSYEIFWHDASATASNIYFENNTCVNAGTVWSHNQRPDGVKGYHIRIGNLLSTCTNIYIRNNIFYNATGHMIYYHNATQLAEMVLDYNNYYSTTGSFAYKEDLPITTYTTLTSWMAVSGQETNSVSTNPLFTNDETTYSIGADSPVRGKGLNIGLIKDFALNNYNNPPSMGALEYAFNIGESLFKKYDGRFITHAGKKIKVNNSSSGNPPYIFPYYFPRTFAWWSDFHVGNIGWSIGEMDAFVANINTRSIEFSLSSGDQITTTGSQSETNTYNAVMANLTTPIYNMRGNHDGSQFTQHFIIDVADVRFICFYASYVAKPIEGDIYNNTGNVSAAELTWIETQLETAGTKRCVLVCHYSLSPEIWGHIDDDNGAVELRALCANYNVKVFLSGHEHGDNQDYVIGGTIHNINSYAMAGGFKYAVCTIYSDRIVFTPYNGSTTFSVTTPITTVNF